ncbi:MAG: hypothetical protein WBQ61_12055, partial [Candidatus Acidiferrum sp.]
GQLTVGLDLGDRSSAYCVLNEAGEIVLEHKLATTPEAVKQVSEAPGRDEDPPACHRLYGYSSLRRRSFYQAI